MSNIFRILKFHLHKLLTIYPPERFFTYFIPAPPKRNVGYQERELNYLIHFLQENNYLVKNVEFKTMNNEGQPGFWVVLRLRAMSQSCPPLEEIDRGKVFDWKEKTRNELAPNIFQHDDEQTTNPN